MFVFELKWEDKQSYYNSAYEEHDCLYQISWQSVQLWLSYFSLDQKGVQTDSFISNDTDEVVPEVLSFSVNLDELVWTKYFASSIKINQCLLFSLAVVVPCQNTS